MQQLQVEVLRLRAEVAEQLQRATGDVQAALEAAARRAREEERARVDAELAAAREAVERLTAQQVRARTRPDAV